MKSKNILITGGAGFIGSHLCKKLLKKDHNILCLDNLLTGSLKNLSDIIDNPNFEFINHDIVIPFYRDGIDEIYNLACPASPIQYQINPIKTIKTCTIGVINMLGLAKKNNAKILQASTSEVYGDPAIHPQHEKYFGNVNTIGPRSCYDEGKRCSETLFMDYHREHKLNIKIIRIFNTYGPYMSVRDGRVVSNFINQALSNENIIINGTGNQTRSFMYIDDLINAMLKTMELGNKFTGPINIGNPYELTINALAKRVIKLTNSKSEVRYNKMPQDDPKRRKPDITLAKDTLKWNPNHDFDLGLIKTIEYFKTLNYGN